MGDGLQEIDPTTRNSTDAFAPEKQVKGMDCSTALALTIILATFIISCLAIAGKMGGPTLGWTAVGLGSGFLLTQLASSLSSKESKPLQLFFAFLLSAAWITLGVLVGTGMGGLGTALTWTLFGTTVLGAGGIGCCAACLCCCGTTAVGIAGLNKCFGEESKV